MKIKELFKTHKQRFKHRLEDVLKFMYKVEIEKKQPVTRSVISQNLSFTMKRIEPVLGELLRQRLIHQTDDETFTLTENGKQKALRIIRKHRMYEKYLAEHTGYPPSDWHRKAEKMEHKLSGDECQELNKMLGNPLVDPHGAPIPSETGEMKKTSGCSLDVLPMYTVGKVINIEDEPEIFYNIIHRHNIHPGTLVRVVNRTNESITLECHNEEIILRYEVARNITVAEDFSVEYESGQLGNIYRLTSLKEGESAEIVGISEAYRGAGRRRLLDLGFVNGSSVSIDLVSPMKNPVAYMVRGTAIALREDQAKYILIHKITKDNE